MLQLIINGKRAIGLGFFAGIKYARPGNLQSGYPADYKLHQINRNFPATML